ncbi:MAG: hypothetical protein Kow0042_03700 [Calditrichia bacterium]
MTKSLDQFKVFTSPFAPRINLTPGILKQGVELKFFFAGEHFFPGDGTGFPPFLKVAGLKS